MVQLSSRIFLSLLLLLFTIYIHASPADPGSTASDIRADLDIPEDIKSSEQDTFTGDLAEIRERRLIRILVTHSRTDFFLDEGQIKGVQAELAREFVQDLNKNIRKESDKLFVQFIPVEFHQLIPALVSGKGDIAAAFLTRTPEREALVDFVGGQSMIVDEVVVTHNDVPPIENLTDLGARRIYVLRDSSYVKHLHDLNKMLSIADVSPIEIIEADERLLSEDILELVNAKVIDITVIDDFKGELWEKVLPNITLLDNIKIATNKQAGWIIRKNSPELDSALKIFARRIRRGTLLGNILFRRYFENTQWIDNPIEQKERDKLAKFIDLFSKYGQQYGFDPLALAAQAFQESRLDNSKKSHRGAVGIMQLMPNTAKDKNVNIQDIKKLENNIHAGAKYLRFLQDRYFSDPSIEPWDQRLFSWAAYNAGPANIIRVRKATAKQGLDANVWFGNVEILAARKISREPVRYVANIHKYYTAYRLVQERDRKRQAAISDVQQ
jgi:membrane-bound lytic murein transglycosylase MltF